MQFKTWVESERGRSGALAVYLKVPPSFVSKMVSGEKLIPVAHGAPIEVFTRGEVTRQEMFPDSWMRIWPELDDGRPLPQAAAPAELTPEEAFLKLASGLELVDRRTSPANRRVAQQPFEGLDRRVAKQQRRACDRVPTDIAGTGQGA